MPTQSQLGVSDPVDFIKPVNVLQLQDKGVLVTGGASGIGAGIVRAFSLFGAHSAEAGAYVTIADLDEKAGTILEEELNGKGYHTLFHKADVTSFVSQTAAFLAAVAHHPQGSLDIVIPCAGVGSIDLRTEAFPSNLPPGAALPQPSTKVLDVNLLGVYYTTHLALHYFNSSRPQPQPFGGADTSEVSNSQSELKHLLLISSMAAYAEFPLMTSYAMSKFGVRGIFVSTRSFASALGGVRVNLLAPWFVRSPMTEGFSDALEAYGYHVAEVEDVVVATKRLCCDGTIRGRAVAVAPRVVGGAEGSGCFDMGDDAEEPAAFRKRLNEGAFGATDDLAVFMELRQ